MAPHFTEVDGIIFCEENLTGRRINSINEIGATQNTTLIDVKRNMARKARAMGGNAVVNFKYSQKADRGLHLLKWDKERLNCSGDVVVLEQHPGGGDLSTSSEETKVCPKCAETIKAAAIKCRFCGSDL